MSDISDREDERLIAVTAEISLERIEREAPDAARLLSVCAYLAPEDIPRRMLLRGASGLAEDERMPMNDARELTAAAGTLVRYSLMDVEIDGFDIHRTLQAAVRKRHAQADSRRWTRAAARIVLSAFPADPEDPDTWAWCARLLPHADRAISHVEDEDADPSIATALRLRTARYVMAQGQIYDARRSLERALEMVAATEPEGRLHGNVLRQLAVADRELLHLRRARAQVLDALRIHLAVLTMRANVQDLPMAPMAPRAPGEREETRHSATDDAGRAVEDTHLPRDADIAEDLRVLGSVAGQQNQFEEAERHFLEALAIYSALPGPTDGQRTTVLEDLFGLYLEGGRGEDAVRRLREALTLREAAGRGKSDEAVVHRAILALLTEPGDLIARARAVARELEARRNPRHPDMAAGQQLLGKFLRRAGELEGARRCFERALTIDRVNYGPDHYRVAADLVDLMVVEARSGDLEAAAARLGEVVRIVLTVAPDEREDALRMSRLGAGLDGVALDERSRPLLDRVLEVVAEADADESVVEGTRWLVIRSLLVSGDQLLASDQPQDARRTLRYGLELARLTPETMLDDAAFLIRLGFLSGQLGDDEEVSARFREALESLRAEGAASPVWALAARCGYVAGGAPRPEPVRAALAELFEEARKERLVAEHHGEIVAAVPDGWFVKESTTLLAPDGSANVIASSEPLDPGIDTEQYAAMQGDLLRAEFPDYKEKAFDRTTVLTDREGYVRRFEWTPPDGERVAQIQLYYAEGGRGYTATATTASTVFAGLEPTLDMALRGLRLMKA